MANVVNTNMMSLNTQKALYKTGVQQATAMERLSSGLRVNSAKDDAAGQAIAERMTTQVRGMQVAVRNANDGISLAQTAEGALGKIADALQRMRELAVQSANATNSADDRLALDAEFQAMGAEITRITDVTKFNGIDVIKNTTDLVFQVGANDQPADTITVTAIDASAGDIAAALTGDVQTNAGAVAAITAIDTALVELNGFRADLGASQNRFSSAIENLNISIENQTASRSRILDADFAAETANLAKSQVLQQAGISMLAQANQAPQSVLKLLG